MSVWPRNLIGHNEDVVFAWGGVCDVPHRIGENVPGAIYVETPLNQEDAFYNREGPFRPKADNIYMVGCRSLHLVFGKFLVIGWYEINYTNKNDK